MTEKSGNCLNKVGLSGALLTDLSKAFDCILNDLSMAELAASGFDCLSPRIIEFLSKRQQRTKISNVLSRYFEILNGVPQESILGHLLFVICDISFDVIKGNCGFDHIC